MQTELERLRQENTRLKSQCCRWWDILNSSEPIPLLKWIISVAPIVVWAVDTEGIVRLAEGKAMERFGKKTCELLGQSVFSLFEEFPQVIAAMRRALSGEQFIEELTIDGHYFEVQFIPVRSVNDQISGVVGVALEVTRRRQAELTLIRRHGFYEEIFSALPVAIVSATPQREIVRMNPAAEKLFGYKTDEITGRLTEILYGDSQSFIEIGEKHAGTDDLMNAELTLRRSDGSTFVSKSICTKIFQADGAVEGLVGIHRDITDELKSAQLINLHEQTLQTMIDTAPVMALLLDTDFNVLFANQRFAAHVEIPVEQLVGISIADLIRGNKEVITNRLNKVQLVIDTSKPLAFVDTYNKKWFEHHLTPVECAEGQKKRVAIFFHDITDRVKREEQERERIAEELHEVVSEMLEGHHEEHGPIRDELRGKPLSPRETQVLKEIATGLSTKQIAHKFSVSIKTVESQRLSIMRKLRIFNVAELTKYALRENLTKLEE